VAKALVAAKKTGAIVNIASTSGHRGRRNAISYCSSKGGVLNFTRAMAMDLAPYGIRVNSVTPTKTGHSVGNLEASGARSYDEIPLGGWRSQTGRTPCRSWHPTGGFVTGRTCASTAGDYDWERGRSLIARTPAV
jgi:NAD(P)-dependent dehydrogenase (short-subunit alcohol dehydrogenase family)